MLPLIWAYFLERNALTLGSPISVRGDSLIASLESHRARLAPIDRYALDFFQLERAAAPTEARLAAARRVAALASIQLKSVKRSCCSLQVARARLLEFRSRRIDPERGWAGTWPAYWNTVSTVQHYLGDYRGEARDVASCPTARRECRRSRRGARADRPRSRRFGECADSRAWRLQLIDRRHAHVAARELRAHGYHTESDSLFRTALSGIALAREAPTFATRSTTPEQRSKRARSKRRVVPRSRCLRTPPRSRAHGKSWSLHSLSSAWSRRKG